MSKVIRAIVVNTDAEATPELRNYLLSIDGVKIVAEIEEPALLANAIDQFPAEVLLVHLDPNPAGMMDIVAPVIDAYKDRVAAVAMTDDRNAELVMRAMRVGMREFLWKPFPPEQLAEVLNRLREGAVSTSRHAGRLIPVMGVCGGVGVTTLVTNLAVELAQLRESNGNGSEAPPKVAVVDLDFRFGQVAMFLDAQPSYTIADLCESPEHIEAQMIERVVVKHASGVHVLAQPNDMDRAEHISAAAVAGALGALQEHYDYVVVDGPVRFDPTARAVLDMTDVCLVTLQLVVPAVRNCDRMLQDLARKGYNMDRIRLVCNRFGREAGFLDASDAEGTLSRKIDYTLPDDWKTSSTAVNVGTPLAEWAPKSRLRLAYRQIAQALAAELPGGSGEPAEQNESTEQRKGLFSLFAGQK